MSHLMIFGAGYSGKAIAKALQGRMARVSGTTRGEDNIMTLQCQAIAPFIFNGETLSDELRAELGNVTHLVQSIAPGASGDPLLRLCDGDLKSVMPKLQWAAYLSTVGVYGNHDGAWVDENTPCRPVSARSTERVEAEDAWTAAADKAGIPVCILRLSGIYGPGRNGFVNLEKGTARRLVKKDQVFNRIRVEDIGAATDFLIDRHMGGIFNVTDDEPAPPQDVVAFAADLMDMEPPEEQAFETAELSPMARSFYGENKRVSNHKLQELGFVFSYPNYRQSLQQLWNDGLWRDE
ncbi:SDR family oxidoreductase [Agrobacterium rosae]|uniref:NAD(P)-dependent oxidoreductase n=1 Tax=Agrobacterium rosae TaxID=1972867 RepID=A0AAE5S1M8_9HYPH|nr:SDR family oxidoreductase [Agrobacterium rosae]MDX8329483.1 SDR family oxidoreductase [Agrobacterium rosae]POO54186.1 NAD(P)-dependent oxidoreductase [Agrobacterium rosae]